ncbi:MAG: carbon monoxide dehydrogenase subunit [Mycobacterium sp.]|jgi:carbon monoxide dehydrogenase subunit G|nr:carbon monoxide dehydrogenase subunit [Mycobacterium sp.]
MLLENSFRVPVPVDEAWLVLLDVQRVVPCMPGATLSEVDGDSFKGKVKVKVGPIVVIYSGTAEFVEKDAALKRVVMSATGKETKGAGTAKAIVTATLVPAGDETEVKVTTDLAITGKPAQFGRGVMADVSNALIGQFATCLAADMASSSVESAQAPANGALSGETASPAMGNAVSEPVMDGHAAGVAGASAARPPSAAPDVIDLLGVSRGPVLKRLAPVVAVILLGGALVALLRRRLAA